MTTDAPHRWVHAPQQARSQRTLEKFLDATEHLLLERGLDAVTVPEVVKVAGSSVGAFYTRFPDKRALLETVHERACRRSLVHADAMLDPLLWKDKTLRDIVQTGVKLAVEVFGSRRNIMNAFAVAFAGDAGFARRRALTAMSIGEKLSQLVLSRQSEIGHPDPKRAVDMALRLVTATLEQRNGFSAGGFAEITLPDEVLTEELERMLIAYLAV